MAYAVKADPISQLEEDLECTVCLEVLKDPRTLPCCHSFCKDCLEGVVQTCRNTAPHGQPIRQIPCPNCRATFSLDPDKHVADMPRNHFICNLVKVTAVLDRGIGVPCSHNCNQSYSVARCVTCEKFLCRECLTIHNSYRGHNGHSVLTMEELSKPENQKKIKGKMYCHEHLNMILKVYCETCDQLICRDCMDFKHIKQEGHLCFLVKDVANNYKELLTSSNKTMEGVLTESNAFVQRLSLTAKQLDREAENIKSQIVQKKDAVLKTVTRVLEQKTETLLNKVNKIHKDKRVNVDKLTEETNHFVENVKSSVQLSKKLVDQGTEEEIISSQKMMLDNANNLLAKREEHILKPTLPVAKLKYTVFGNKEPIKEGLLRTLANSLGDVIENNEDQVTEKVADRKEILKEKESAGKVFVAGLPEDVTEASLAIHFQKKKNGGGEIERVTLLAGGKAFIFFEDPEVAKTVANTKQIFKGKELDVKLLETEASKKVEESRNEKRETRTILVSGLPEESTKNSVWINFQKRKNGGGEIENVQLLGQGKAIIVFEDPQVAKRVLEIEQIFRGKIVHAELVDTETHMNEETSEKGRSSDYTPTLVSYAGKLYSRDNVLTSRSYGKNSKDDECSICLSEFTKKKTLDKCGHSFCTMCIDRAFQHKKQCPLCFTVYGPLTGNQPPGNMYESFQSESLPGFGSCGIIVISYRFPSGIQGLDHPNPGKTYTGTGQTAYLPNNDQGRKVLKLLRKAFNQKLTFTIGQSNTTGRGDCVIWNDIHHKTSMIGGPTCYGYPDPDYLKRVTDELAAKGITE